MGLHPRRAKLLPEAMRRTLAAPYRIASAFFNKRDIRHKNPLVRLRRLAIPGGDVRDFRFRLEICPARSRALLDGIDGEFVTHDGAFKKYLPDGFLAIFDDAFDGGDIFLLSGNLDSNCFRGHFPHTKALEMLSLPASCLRPDS